MLKIEEGIAGVDGIREILATAGEDRGTVNAVIDTGADADRVLQDIQSEVDRITTFPEEAEEPVVSKALIKNEVISAVVYGSAGERARRQWAERIRDDLLELPEITQAGLVGVRPYEIAIEVREEMLRRHGLTLEQVATGVQRASQDIPGGTIESEGGEILLRTQERRYLGREYEDIVIAASPDGMLLRLGELATVRDGFEDIDLISRFNGQPAAMVQVFRVGDQRPTEIADTVRAYMARLQPEVPLSLQTALWNDNTEVLRSRFQLLLKNAAIGLLLVFAILGAFMRFRLALWVMLGLPVAFLGAFFFMPAFGVSINMISLFAFIMALGIVVDNSVVVGESIYERQRATALGQQPRTAPADQASAPVAAAIAGTREVAVPVVFSVLTTVAAFVPLFYISGTMGKFISNIPVVLISILLVSLAISLFSLPALLAWAGRGGPAAAADQAPGNGRVPGRHLPGKGQDQRQDQGRARGRTKGRARAGPGQDQGQGDGTDKPGNTDRAIGSNGWPTGCWTG
ncbi:MAG: efflux RND transporter permease subunit [Desulfurivibrio sp.]|nr:efflux RND transporter permease subunit [Desulfurivibrio sp.]